MLQALTTQQSQWVDKTLSGLSLEQAVGQLLCISQFNDSMDYWLPLMEKVPFGAARARSETAEGYRSFLSELQQHAAIPLLVPANMEHGAAELRGYGTEFPWSMGIGAANDEALVAVMGEAIATEARYVGVNWLFNPVIDAGVMCIMPGHIALPDYQGYQAHPEDAPPATISRKILVDLLRQELGYDGLIVSDNASMIGFTTRAKAEDLVVESIAAGIDIYLNAVPEHDFDRLLQGVHDGRVSEERIYEAAKRVLEMKARLNLFEDVAVSAPSREQQIRFQNAAQAMADKSITVLRGGDDLAFNLQGGEKALTVTIGNLAPHMGHGDLDVFDQELRERGLQVEHLLNPTSDELRQKAEDVDLIFVNLDNIPFATLANIRVTDTFRTWGWRSIYRTHPKVAYTAFGSPYVLHELPPVPRLIAAYGNSDCSQRAAVKVLLGEIEPVGTLPVRMPKVDIKRWPID